MKQLYFSFIPNYLNHANIAWASTKKSNLISLYRHQKHAIRIIYDKERFTHTKPLFKHAKALTAYKINLFHIYLWYVSVKTESFFNYHSFFIIYTL